MACILVLVVIFFSALFTPCQLQPNVLVIYVEDINLLGSIFIAGEKYRNIDQLSRHELKLRELYANGDFPGFRSIIKRSVSFSNANGESASTASTAALLTGDYAVESGFVQGKILPFKEIPSLASTAGLSTSKATIASALQERGYFTAYVGYWKLGFGVNGLETPLKHGFDFWTGVSAAHSGHCKGINASERLASGAFRHQYLDVMYTTLPFWLSMAIGIVSMYCINRLSLKAMLNCLLYLYIGTCVFYLLLEAFFAIKPATCVFYHGDKIISQPYNSENITLHMTLSVMNLLEAAAEEQRRFYIHLNYLQMRKPHVASRVFDRNSSDPLDRFVSSATELDWSIQMLLESLDKHNLAHNTVLVFTGGNNCDLIGQLERTRTEKVFTMQESGTFFVNDVPGASTLRTCFHVPLYVMWEKEAKIKTVHTPVSIMDILPTISHVCNISSKPHLPGRSLVPLLTENIDFYHSGNNYIATSLQRPRLTNSAVNESQQCSSAASRVTQMTNYHELLVKLFNRNFIFYDNIVKSCAVLLESRYWVVLLPQKSEGYSTHPMVVDVSQALASSADQEITNATLYEKYKTARHHAEGHVTKRTNRWSSQFEMPLYPWIFPCANFPLCQQILDFPEFPWLEFDSPTS